MAQSFVGGFHLVEVTTDELVRGLPKKQLWVAAAKREQAITLVLAAVPEGWTAVLLDTHLESEEAAQFNLRPGDVRELMRSLPPGRRWSHFGWTFKGQRALRPLTPGGDSKPGALVMCDIPMDLERRFERRWAVRFSGPAKEHRLEEQQQRVTEPDASKTRNRQTGEREPETAPIIPRTVASLDLLTSR
jgi:hypothetical protein